MVVTVRQFKISSGACSRFKRHMLHLLRFWKMDPSWPGVVQIVVVTVREFEISSRVCSRFKPHKWAFAAILEDGSVVTWGRADHGGDSSAVQDELRGVQQIQATHAALAAILADGSVVTWGRADCGGDSSGVQISSRVCSRFRQNVGLFAAILEDGSVVTWGYASGGGDSSAVRDQLKGVQQIQVTDCAFAAILEDGSVVTWGHGGFGGDSWAVRDQPEFCLVQLCFPKWQSLRSYSYRNRRCWSFCSAVTPSGPGCWKRWGSYKRSQQKCCFFLFFLLKKLPTWKSQLIWLLNAFSDSTLTPCCHLLEEYFFHDFQLGCRLAFRFPPKINPICQKMSQTWYATKQPVLTGWMFGDFQALFILKIWFIIQPKRPLNNGCLGYQVLEVEEPLFMKGPHRNDKKKKLLHPIVVQRPPKKTTTCFH